MTKVFCAICLLMIFQPVPAADLVEALRAARGYDASFAAAARTRDAGREKVQQARALLLPQVALAGNGAYNYNRYAAGQGDASYEKDGASHGYSVSATQPVYRIEKLAGSDQLKKQAALAEIQYRISEQDLILRVAKAYFDVVTAEEKIRVIDAQKEAISQQLARAKKSFEVGEATITDTDEAQARFDAALAQEIAGHNDLAVKREAFVLLTSLEGGKLARIGDRQQPAAPEPNDPATWFDRAERNNFALAGQRINLEIARREIDKYRAETAPSLDLTASYGDSWKAGGISNSGARDRNGSGVIGLQLSVPLYTGGNRSSQMREAVAREDAQRNTVEAVRRDTVQETRRAFLGVQSGAAQIRALQQALVSSKSLVDSTTLGREVGVRTTIDVLNALQQYFSTRYDLMVARSNYLYSRLQLVAAAGELTETDVVEVNRWLSE